MNYESAFPQTSPYLGDNRGYNFTGMSLRDYFAANASDPPAEWMRRVCNTDNPYDVGGGEICDTIAMWRYMQADAMLQRRVGGA
jgi:hypothetical protein